MKNLSKLLIIFSSLVVTNLRAQTPLFIDWASNYQHTVDDNYSNEARKVLLDELTGNIYTLQDVTSNIDLQGNVNSNIYSYTILSKYDNTGTLIDHVTVDVNNHSTNGFDRKSAFGMELDAAGNIYIGYASYDATTDFDVNIAKYDNNLVQQWNNKLNPTTLETGVDLKVTASGTAFAIVKSTALGNTRYKIMKADGPGTATTALYTFNIYADFLNSLAIDANDHLFVTGYRVLSGVKNVLYASFNDMGTLRWMRTDNCGTLTGDDYGRHLSVGGDGKIYITGSSIGTINHGNDVFTFKVNPVSGKKIWESFINYTLNDGGAFVLTPDAANTYVSWVASNTVFIDLISAVSGSFIRRVTYQPIPIDPYSNLNGASISDMKISNTNGVYVSGSILADDNGQDFSGSFLIKATFTARGLPRVEYELPVLGNNASSFKGGTMALDHSNSKVYFLEDQFDSYNSHQQEMVVLMSVNVPGALRTGKKEMELQSVQSLLIGPNPAQDHLDVTSGTVINRLEIYDINGKIVIRNPINETNQATLNVDGLPSGVYYLKSYSVDGTSNSRSFVKN